MIAITVTIVVAVVLVGLSVWREAVGLFVVGILLVVVAGVAWLSFTIINLTCEGLADSYQEPIRHDWATGCMLELDDGREIQVDSDSIAFIVRDLLEDS